MPNPFKDWARMNRANKSQGRPSSFFVQFADIPNWMHEAADATEIGMRMMRLRSWRTAQASAPPSP
jgi:hypothetical protein